MTDAPVDPAEPSAPAAPVRRPIFASLATLIGLAQLYGIWWWFKGQGARQLQEAAFETRNLVLHVLEPFMGSFIMMAVMAVYVAGAAFLGVALWRREQPHWMSWLAAGVLLLSFMILIW